MAVDLDDKVTVVLPSIMGSEKVAMEKAAAVARDMGFSEDRIEDLKTAVSEACLNAMEHGNELDEKTFLGVTLTSGPSGLEVAVQDEGKGMGSIPVPSLENKIEGVDESKRGWGIFLIRGLMDEVQFMADDHGRNTVKMVIHLEK
jgi:serine/threonine-protein kinase RsbW